MKKLIYTILLTLAFSLMANASGKFIFEPEANYTKSENRVKMGLSVYEKVLGPVSWNHYTGTSLLSEAQDSQHKFSDFVFQNGFITSIKGKADLEIGHKYLHNFKTKYNENKGYLKISVPLW
jgi:hypothetical protein